MACLRSFIVVLATFILVPVVATASCAKRNADGTCAIPSGDDASSLLQSKVSTQDVEEHSFSLPTTQHPWRVQWGECVQDDAGCITSPNYPENYGNDQTCGIKLEGDASPAIEVVDWSVNQESWDKLRVNGQYYSTNDFDGIVPTADMYWSADEKTKAAKGWKICPKAAGPNPNPAPTPAPTSPTEAPGPAPSPPTTQHPWSIYWGPCALDDAGCITSPNYPENYGNDQSCGLKLEGDTSPAIKVVDFSVNQESFDKLQVNGHYYGDDSFDGIVPTADMYWTSADGTKAAKGWKICPQAAGPNPTPAPTSAPAPAPTLPPTSAPTPAPTTMPPTEAPGPNPNPAPTPAPTSAPTPVPTLPPTSAPTPAPTTMPPTEAPGVDMTEEGFSVLLRNLAADDDFRDKIMSMLRALAG